MLFGYFFIFGTAFLIMSGVVDDIKINKWISLSLLFSMLVLGIINEINIKYLFQFNLGWLFVLLIGVVLFALMKKEYISSIVYAASMGILLWALGEYIPIFNEWYIRAVLCTIFSLILADGYCQCGFLSVMGYVISYSIFTVFSQDLELALFRFGVGSEFSGIAVALIAPIIIRAAIINFEKGMELKHGTIA